MSSLAGSQRLILDTIKISPYSKSSKKVTKEKTDEQIHKNVAGEEPAKFPGSLYLSRLSNCMFVRQKIVKQNL